MISQQFAHLTELFVLLQPQAGATAGTVDPPLAIGAVIDDPDAGGPSVPQTMTVVRFRDKEHLVAQIIDTVLQTLARRSSTPSSGK